MATVRILFFSVLRETLGLGSVELALERSMSAGEVLDHLVDEYPRLEPYRSAIRVAVNETYVDQNHAVEAGDEVALITPVSGG